MRTSPEFALIERVRDALRAAGVEPGESVLGIGDDAAITSGEGVRVTSIDLFVEGVHFTGAFTDHQIGHKALAGALSDLAAMGATPREAYVGLIVPPGFDSDRAVAIAGGIGEVAAGHGVSVLGGDISAGSGLGLAVTVVGSAQSADQLVSRAGARAGDTVLVSGSLGAAAAGLLVLGDPSLAEGLPGEQVDALKRRQLTPRPQLGLGIALARSGASAMIDVSDGIVADAEQIASESDVELNIEVERLPVATGVAEVAQAAGSEPLALVGAGEDYELLLTVPAAAVDDVRAAAGELGERLTEVGVVGPGSGVSLSGPSAALAPGFDHLRA